MIIRKKSVLKRERICSILNPKSDEDVNVTHVEIYLVTTVLFLGIPIYTNQSPVTKSHTGGVNYCSTI